jgi:hypothetical protein
VQELSMSKDFKVDKDFLHLNAKILSSQKNDEEAIIILNGLIEMLKPSIDTESNNLLSASIKREAFKVFELYGDVERLTEKLSIAKEGYLSVYRLNNDYYPALNYMYLQSMIAKIKSQNIEALHSQYKNIWAKLEYKINDWWSYISGVEYLILIEQYDDALTQLKLHFETVDSAETNDFEIVSTLRQLRLYSEFCDDVGLNQVIDFLEKQIPNDKE